MASRIRRGDKVQIMAGKDKGKSGVVLRVLPEKERVMVRGVNMIKKHTRPTQKSPQGGIQDKEAAIHISNVMLVDPQDNKPVRPKFIQVDDRKVRVSRRTNAEFPDVQEIAEQ